MSKSAQCGLLQLSRNSYHSGGATLGKTYPSRFQPHLSICKTQKKYSSDLGCIFIQGGVQLWLGPPLLWSRSRCSPRIQNCFCDILAVPLSMALSILRYCLLLYYTMRNHISIVLFGVSCSAINVFKLCLLIHPSLLLIITVCRTLFVLILGCSTGFKFLLLVFQGKARICVVLS